MANCQLLQARKQKKIDSLATKVWRVLAFFILGGKVFNSHNHLAPPSMIRDSIPKWTTKILGHTLSYTFHFFSGGEARRPLDLYRIITEFLSHQLKVLFVLFSGVLLKNWRRHEFIFESLSTDLRPLWNIKYTFFGRFKTTEFGPKICFHIMEKNIFLSIQCVTNIVKAVAACLYGL